MVFAFLVSCSSQLVAANLAVERTSGREEHAYSKQLDCRNRKKSDGEGESKKKRERREELSKEKRETRCALLLY